MNQNELIINDFQSSREKSQNTIDQNTKLIEFYKAKIEHLEAENIAEQQKIDVLDKYLDGDYNKPKQTPDISAPVTLSKITPVENVIPPTNHVKVNYKEAILRILTNATKPISLNLIIKRVCGDKGLTVNNGASQEIFLKVINKMIAKGLIGSENSSGIIEYFRITKMRETTKLKHDKMKNHIFSILDSESCGITRIIQLLVEKYNYSPYINKDVARNLKELLDENIIEFANSDSKHKKYCLALLSSKNA